MPKYMLKIDLFVKTKNVKLSNVDLAKQVRFILGLLAKKMPHIKNLSMLKNQFLVFFLIKNSCSSGFSRGYYFFQKKSKLIYENIF